MKYTIIFLVLSSVLAVFSAHVAHTDVLQAVSNKQVGRACNINDDCFSPCALVCPNNDGGFCYFRTCVCKPK